MKKLLLLFLVLFYISSFGQVSFGLKAGLNVNDRAIKNNSSSSIQDNSRPDIGFHVGVFGELKFGKKILFIPEVYFSQKGFVLSAVASDARVNLNYLELPLIISYSPIPRLSIDLGPSFAYKISAVAKRDDHTKINIDDVFTENFDFGINGGLRFKVSERVSIIGRYSYGLVAIEEHRFRDVNNNPEGSVKYYNRTIQMSLSYRIK